MFHSISKLRSTKSHYFTLPLLARLLFICILISQNSSVAFQPPSCYRSSSVCSLSATPVTSSEDFLIRQCLFGELNDVAGIFIESFYNTSTSWKKLYQLAELNRLQQTFPYGEVEHQMMVAILDSKVVGFVDVNGLPPKPNQPKLPRPYLSDLAVRPDYRRQGIAKALVQKCETFVVQDMGKKDLWIRVEEANEAAVSMYRDLGYHVTGTEEARVREDTKEMANVLILTKEINW